MDSWASGPGSIPANAGSLFHSELIFFKRELKTKASQGLQDPEDIAFEVYNKYPSPSVYQLRKHWGSTPGRRRGFYAEAFSNW